MSRVLYHGTSHPNADQTGLELREAPGAMSDDLSNGPAVYLTDDPQHATEYGPYVYAVNVEGLPVDLVDSMDGYDYLARQAIEPQRITRYARTQIPEDFKNLLPKQAAPKTDDRPDYLWVYDPETTQVHLEKEKGDHPAHFPVHEEMATHVTHDDRKEGYAWAIEGGWRIVDRTEGKVEDPFLLRRIREALRGEHPAPLLPKIRYHGDPNKP